MQDNNEKMLILQIVYWLHIYHTTKYITSTPTNTHGKQRNNFQSQCTTNASIFEENKNKKSDHRLWYC
jgi:hypothetical protein